MDHIVYTSELAGRGHSPSEIDALVRTGALLRLRRGAYLVAGTKDSPSDRQQHRRLIEATTEQLGGGAVVSHMSAAVLHGLPIWRDQLTTVHVIRDRDGGGRTRRYVRVRGLPLAPEDVTVIDGFLVTSLARTVLDLACELSMRRSVSIGDAALRLVATTEPGRNLREELDRTVARAARRPGVPAARRAIAFLDPRSESPGESASRVIMHDHGLPAPELQYVIVDGCGRFVARTDFAWLAQRVVGEFDGAVKYSGQLGKAPEQVVLEERRRENAIRSCGFDVLRWTWPELQQPHTFAATVRRALARGAA